MRTYETGDIFKPGEGMVTRSPIRTSTCTRLRLRDAPRRIRRVAGRRLSPRNGEITEMVTLSCRSIPPTIRVITIFRSLPEEARQPRLFLQSGKIYTATRLPAPQSARGKRSLTEGSCGRIRASSCWVRCTSAIWGEMIAARMYLSVC